MRATLLVVTGRLTTGLRATALVAAGLLATGLLATAPRITVPLGAQSLAARVRASDGLVQVVFPSRPEACGDGAGMIGDVLGESGFGGPARQPIRSRYSMNRPCVHGPARAVATIVRGEVTRIRTFVGPVSPAPTDVRTIDAPSAEAATWLAALADTASGRVASDVMLPLVLADRSEPWPLFLRIARDDHRSREVRRTALSWLARAVTHQLGLDAPSYDLTDDDEMRSQAVFVLAQRPKNESVPELIDLVRASPRPAVRRSAIFWLGQTADGRAADLYAELLRLR